MPLVSFLILRFLQTLGLIALVIGLLQIGPLVTMISAMLAGAPWELPKLCARIAAVTGPAFIAALAVGGLQRTINRAYQSQLATQRHSHQPWLTNPMWAAKHIRLSNSPALIAFISFVTLFTLVVLPLAIASEQKAFVIFAIVAALFVSLFFRMIWINRIWGRSELRLSTLPGVIGGHFTAVAILDQTFPADTVFEASLKCDEAEIMGTRKSRKMRVNTRWSSLIHINKTLSGSPLGTTAVPVSFAIPYDCLSTRLRGENTVHWFLSISEKGKTETGCATFEVPIFRTEDSRKDFEPDSGLIDAYLEKTDAVTLLERRYHLRRTLTAQGTKFEFHEFDMGLLIGMLIVIAISAAIIGAIFYWVTTWNSRWFASVFPGFFLAIGIWGIIQLLFWRGTIETLEELSPDAPKAMPMVRAKSGVLGFRRTMVVPRDATSALSCKLLHRTDGKENWGILLNAPGKKPLKLLQMLESSSEAMAVQNWLQEQLGVEKIAVTPEHGFGQSPRGR